MQLFAQELKVRDSTTPRFPHGPSHALANPARADDFFYLLS